MVCGDGGIGFWSRGMCVCPVSGVRGWERALLTPRPVWPQVCQGILRARGIYDCPQLTPATQHLQTSPPINRPLQQGKQCVYSHTSSRVIVNILCFRFDSRSSFSLVFKAGFVVMVCANITHVVYSC